MPSQTRADNFLFVGTHGHVLAIDKHDGTTVWDRSLPKTGFQVVVMLVEDGRLLCGTAGRAFALDPSNGRILWENNLPGMGQGVVGICTIKQATSAAPAIAGQLAANQSAAGGPGHASG